MVARNGSVAAALVVGLASLGCSGIHWLDHRPDLTVNSTQSTKELANVSAEPADGSYWLELGVAVTNRSGQDWSGTFDGFSVETATGASFPPSTVTYDLNSGCDANALVSKGMTATCTVVFEVPEDDDVATLHFSPPRGPEAHVDVSPPSCTFCRKICVDLASDWGNCGECGNGLDEDQECVDGEPACADPSDTLCADGCADLDHDEDNCGSCGTTVPSGEACKNGEPGCAASNETLCDDGCKALDSDEANCGECGRVCPGDGSALCKSNGTQCKEEVDLTLTTCDAQCAAIAAGYTCTDTTAFYHASYGPIGLYGCETASVACDAPPPSFDPEGGACDFDYAICTCFYTF